MCVAWGSCGRREYSYGLSGLVHGAGLQPPLVQSMDLLPLGLQSFQGTLISPHLKPPSSLFPISVLVKSLLVFSVNPDVEVEALRSAFLTMLTAVSLAAPNSLQISLLTPEKKPCLPSEVRLCSLDSISSQLNVCCVIMCVHILL